MIHYSTICIYVVWRVTIASITCSTHKNIPTETHTNACVLNWINRETFSRLVSSHTQMFNICLDIDFRRFSILFSLVQLSLKQKVKIEKENEKLFEIEQTTLDETKKEKRKNEIREHMWLSSSLSPIDQQVVFSLIYIVVVYTLHSHRVVETSVWTNCFILFFDWFFSVWIDSN